MALFIEAGDDRTRNELQTTGETEQVPKLGRRTERDRQEVNMVPCGSDVRNPRRYFAGTETAARRAVMGVGSF